MRIIPIKTRKDGVFNMLVDDIDYPHLIKRKWWLRNKKRPYAATNNVDPENLNRLVVIHRILMGLTDTDLCVDHIDGDTLNNQRSNLRIATRSQNNMNMRKNERNISGYKGVSYFKNDKHRKYGAQIKVNGIKIYGGSFSRPEDAAKRYNELALQHFGPFAKINEGL